MTIRYGVNRRKPGSRGKVYEQRNYELEIPGIDSWEDPRLHEEIRKKAAELHPGWGLVGYCQAFTKLNAQGEER